MIPIRNAAYSTSLAMACVAAGKLKMSSTEACSSIAASLIRGIVTCTGLIAEVAMMLAPPKAVPAAAKGRLRAIT